MTTFLKGSCEMCNKPYDDTFEFDLQGCPLCPECAEECKIPCDVCGEKNPVRIYPEDGSNPTGELVGALPLPDGTMWDFDDITGCEDYIAICQKCDNPEGVMKP